MKQNPRIFALIVAAGTGARAVGPVPKQYLPIAGRPMLRFSMAALAGHGRIEAVQVVIARGHEKYYEQAAASFIPPPAGGRLGGGPGQGSALPRPHPNPPPMGEGILLPPVIGGVERQDSVRAGLAALAAHRPDYVLIHDAARPFLTHGVIDRLLAKMAADKGVVPALKLADTVRRLENGKWEEVDRHGLLRMQTPQLFPYGKLCELQKEDIAVFTDDAGLWLAEGLALDYALGEEGLRKVTTHEDIAWAESFARGRIAVGSGFDVHRLAAGGGSKGIMLGGVAIAHDKVLEGHSDADVVLHALTDAILGAIGEGDIGMHFPPGDEQWKGADSAQFVREALRLTSARGGRIAHADVTIICEAPKIGPHRDAMRARIAELLALSPAQVSVKATTTEGLGFTGRGEGIAAQATVTLELPGAA
ncbi:MAG: 2-C-methyl-D-erythritol 2,4-cyclodiphosphate synthase [Alphaproteobacteria bacterium]